MKDTPVSGINAPTSEWPKNTDRSTACATNPPAQPRISGIFRVSLAFSIVPVNRTTTGSSQSTTPVVKLVNWYGGAPPTQGNSASVTAMPVLEGLKTCRRRPLTRTRTRYLLALLTTTANTYGHGEELPYRIMPQARPTMCAGSRKSISGRHPPAYSGRRTRRRSVPRPAGAGSPSSQHRRSVRPELHGVASGPDLDVGPVRAAPVDPAHRRRHRRVGEHHVQVGRGHARVPVRRVELRLLRGEPVGQLELGADGRPETAGGTGQHEVQVGCRPAARAPVVQQQGVLPLVGDHGVQPAVSVDVAERERPGDGGVAEPEQRREVHVAAAGPADPERVVVVAGHIVPGGEQRPEPGVVDKHVVAHGQLLQQWPPVPGAAQEAGRL